MRVAAIHLGSYSFHLLVAEITGASSFRILVQDAMLMQLGRTALLTGRLDPNDMARGLQCLAEFRRLTLSRRVERTFAIATGVIREAENGDDFLRRACRVGGFHIRTISGREEARLIHLAVSRGLGLQERALLVDIGGGSVRLSVGDGDRIYFATALRLGFLRMHGRFITKDPVSKLEARALASFLRESLRASAAAIRRRNPSRVIATGSPVTVLSTLARRLRASPGPGQDGAERVRRSEIRRIISSLAELPAIERAGRFDLDSVQAESLPTALMILDAVLGSAGRRAVEISSADLCEGVIHDFLQARPPSAAPPAEGDPRMQAVLDLAARCDYPAEHSHRVALLAGQIFRQTAGLHGLGQVEGRLLERASILHDIGYHISYSGHHKHAHHLVMHSELRGFTPAERRLLANLVRYHRGAAPRASHASFRALSPPEQQVVRRLSAVLRIADALDMSHFCVVDEIQLRAAGRRIYFLLLANGMFRRAPLDMGAVKRHARLFEKLFGVETVFRIRRSRPRPSDSETPNRT
ncbi:MAG: Ppx/GppA family phosphatase [Acidobacteria bacterium]|nr:Ppx/GppA family phosphatase [Acidobacteriota bacterium]